MEPGPLPRGGRSWSWLGRLGYAAAVELMEAHRAAVLAGDEAAEAVLLCEHDPVVTLGRGADRTHVLVSRAALEARGVALFESSRGGDVTYHGPGQLMVYPVVRLRRGVVAHLEAVAGALAEAAAELGAHGASWRRQPAGLWLGGRKLAACGLHVSRAVSIHGFALDVSTPPEAWRLIVPCGLGGGVTISLAEAMGETPVPSVAEVAERVGPRVTAALERLR